MLNKTVCILFNRESGEKYGAYSRAYHMEYEFRSPSEARNSNVHGIFKDKDKYRVAQYKVYYKLVTAEAD